MRIYRGRVGGLAVVNMKSHRRSRRSWGFLPSLCFFLLAVVAVAETPALEINIVAGRNLARNAAASAAFERAAAQWEAVLDDPVTVIIRADLRRLGRTVLGESSSRLMSRNFDDVVAAMIADGGDETDDEWLNHLAQSA